MNCVGIDVSKGKSMIAVMRLFGEVVVSPFEVRHTASELSELARLLKSLDGETRVVMESCCSVRFKQVEPPNAGEFALPNRLNRQREKMDFRLQILGIGGM